ncbi:LigA protein [Streptomyces bicolor]|uniref:LigA protein n=1 Tax=Streptomyces bicolor TaxID=66874 RepID=UPI0004E19EA7|nr:LigA protein [Streptomyces bicolor]
MAGREFGHHLGLPRALSGLPLSPLVPGYAELATAQHAAGLRHLGAALLPPGGGGLRVLDGLYVPSGPRGRRRVDGALLDDLAARAGNPTASLAGLLAGLQRRDPQAPRRVVLYQLIGLLQERGPAERPRLAVELGVHPDEVAGLVAAARLGPTLTRHQRDAAESLADAWERHRLHRVRALLERLPQDGTDQALEALRGALTVRLAAVEASLRAAREAEERGDTERATEELLRALHEAADDRRALRALVRQHRPGSGRPTLLRAKLAQESVQLTWPETDAEGNADWLLLCLHRDGKGTPKVREVAGQGAGAGTARDTAVTLGSDVRYAALPLRDGRVAGPPLVSRRVLVAPEVEELTLTDGPGRVEGRWRRPNGAAEVTVEWTGPDGGAGQLPPGTDGFTATGLAVGAHAFRVVCHYRTPGGTLVPSPGVHATRTVHPWPEPVRTLTAHPAGTALRFDWTGARDTEVRLVRWPGEPPAPGSELRTEQLPARLDRPERAGVLDPLPVGHTRVSAVAVLGERALAGPVVDVEVLRPVTGLAGRRLPEGHASITLDWPDGIGHLLVTWEHLAATGTSPAPGTSAAYATGPATITGGQRTVTSHAYRRNGLRLPVGPGGVLIRASTAPQTPGAVVVPAAAAEVVLPPDTTIGYQLVRAPRRLLGRGSRTLLRVTLTAPRGHTGVPEFVCVARSGTLRPRSATDGTTVLRIPGTDLTRHGTVEQELPAAPCPAPYTLRGFLLGEHAAAVRLEEPSPATLVVR